MSQQGPDHSGLRQRARDLITEFLEWKKGQASDAPPRRRVRRDAALGAVLGVLLLAAVASALVQSRAFARRPEVPEELLGLWRTWTPAYAGRALAIRADVVVFYTAPAESTVYPIRAVRRRLEGEEGIRHTIDYLVGGEVYTLAFYHRGGRWGRIRFVNQPDIWWQQL